MTKTKEFSRYARRTAKPVKSKPCIHCPNESKSRGLCTSCLAAANRKVATKEVSWDLLEKLGLVEAKIKIPFLIALEAALANSKGRATASRKPVK